MEQSLYCLVFNVQSSKPALEHVINRMTKIGCTDIQKGPTEFSIEFRLDESSLTHAGWALLFEIEQFAVDALGLEKERSALPFRSK